MIYLLVELWKTDVVEMINLRELASYRRNLLYTGGGSRRGVLITHWT